MSCVKHRKTANAAWLLILAFSLETGLHAQQPITSIVTTGSTAPMQTFPNVKGAGLKRSGTPISNWDSIGTNFTVRYNVPAPYNTLSLTQFAVGGYTSPLISIPVGATVKVRRLGNAEITNARNAFCFWAASGTTPANTDLSGTFNFTAPQVTSMESALLSNNLTSGYDNLFQNTTASPHYSNVERLDLIVPGGLVPRTDTDRIYSGFIVIDRGAGDPFKIAAVTAVNATNDPTAYGPLLSVTTASFGADLLPAAFNYIILNNDVNYGSQSRPSSRGTQNLRGVFISLADLGIAKNQKVYGYSLFGTDVMTANPDWTTYPNNSNNLASLDPVNVLGVYKTAFSALPVSLSFSVRKMESAVKLMFTVHTSINNDHIEMQRSTDGVHYSSIGNIQRAEERSYEFTDDSPAEGNNYYRLKMVDTDGSFAYSEAKLVPFAKPGRISIYPVPAREVFYADFPKAWAGKKLQVELRNNLGQLVRQSSLPASRTRAEIHTRGLPDGTYTVRLTNLSNGLALTEQVVIRK